MKSIRDFIAGKIVRSETQEVLELAPPGAAHPDLGGDEGALVGPNGQIQFFERGMLLHGGEVVVYEDIDGVFIEPAHGGAERRLDVILRDGTVKRLSTSPPGAVVVHATLRWIGHTRLHRDIADTVGP